MIKIRNWQAADLSAIVEIRQAAHPLDHTDAPRTFDTVRREMGSPGLDPQRNVFVAEEDDGHVIDMDL